MNTGPVGIDVCPEPMGLASDRLVLEFCDAALSPEQRTSLLGVLGSWPRAALERLAPRGFLRIGTCRREDLRHRYPEVISNRSVILLRPGELLLLDPHRLPEDPFSFRILFQSLLEEFQPGRVMETPADRRTVSYLFPPDFRLAATNIVRQIAGQGLHYQPSSLLHAEFGMIHTVAEPGKSSHQLRLRTTNPALNRWIYDRFVDPLVSVDPGFQIYAGLFATVDTRPFALVGIFAWGADAELTTLWGHRLFLDSNLQHRVRSSEEIPSEKFLVENTVRIESGDRRIAFGIGTQLRPIPSPEIRLALMGIVLFD